MYERVAITVKSAKGYEALRERGIGIEHGRRNVRIATETPLYKITTSSAPKPLGDSIFKIYNLREA